MKTSTDLHQLRNKKYYMAGIALCAILAIFSLLVGKYPLSVKALLAGNPLHWRVFINLRLSRMLVGVLGGFTLGVAGFTFQTIFRNPLASPDIIGVSSGASAGAAAGILFFSGMAVTVLSMTGAVLAVILALALSAIDRSGKNGTIVLAGIAVHSLAQTFLMWLKLTADPERELASIEYWIMGSLNAINMKSIILNLSISLICVAALFLLHRQFLLLSTGEYEAKMLGVDVNRIRLVVLFLATLAVSGIISLTGLISFVALVAPHLARLLTKSNQTGTMFLSGTLGGILLVTADILARSVAQTELPVSIFTSLIGAPFLIFLIVKERK